MRKEGKRRAVAIGVLVAVAAAVIAVILIDRGGGSTVASAPGCEAVDQPEPKDTSLPAPKQTVKPGEALTAVVKTNCGSFEIALDTERAPKTVNSFAYLARQGYYDGLDFYRAISGFALYAGDPSGDGTGGPGYTTTEPPPAKAVYSKGVVAMARSLGEPSGIAGSAFFVVTSRNTGYPPEYALLGEVSKGYGTIARLNRMATPHEQLSQTVLTEQITIRKG